MDPIACLKLAESAFMGENYEDVAYYLSRYAVWRHMNGCEPIMATGETGDQVYDRMYDLLDKV